MTHRYHIFIAICLLLLFFAQVIPATTRTSITSDEGPQLTSAYAYLTTGDVHLVEFDGHPPLAKSLNALPLLFIPDLGSPEDTDAWTSRDPISLIWVTQQFLYPYRPLDRIVVAARVPVALWGILLGALVHRWASDLFGPSAGLGALLLVTFDPNLLAHAGLATNDLAVTTACLAAMFTFWRCLNRPTFWRCLLGGLTLGIAQGTKLNALLLLPVQAALALVYGLWPPTSKQLPKPGKETRNRWAGLLKNSALIWLVAGLTLWASYGFELRTPPGWPLPIPAGTHVQLWKRVFEATSGGHPSFLMGEISTKGWWHYFAVAFAIKTPIPTLLALCGAAICFLKGWRRALTAELALGLFIALYAAATVFSRLNIGYRHILPVLPFLYVFTGRVFSATSRQARWQRAPSATKTQPKKWQLWGMRGILIGSVAWLMAGTVTLWPFHLAYFNELIGGPNQGYRYLVDSNTDWGQNLKALSHYLEQAGIEQISLSTYIEYGAAFESYGLNIRPLPPLHAAPGILPRRFNPAPGVYAISTTTLQGIFTADAEMYDWFRQHKPDARIGHTLFVYHVPQPVPSPTWVAQCTVPAAPLPEHVLAEGFGRADLRRVYFDCTQSWIIPTGGQAPGWYGLFRSTAQADDAFIQTYLETNALSFQQTRSTTLPPFSLYEAQGTWPAPTHPANGIVKVGALRFLGHTILAEEATPSAELWIYWQVEACPNRPLSLMLHLLTPDGALVADGLGVPVEQWHVGDVFIQRHKLDLPEDVSPAAHTLYTGAYWLDTLDRWDVTINQKPAGDTVPLVWP